MNEDEIFYPLKGWEGFYEINKKSEMRTVERICIHKNGTRQLYKSKMKINKSITSAGYYCTKIQIAEINKKGCYSVHRLVAETFIPNPNNYKTVNHKDGNRLNNHVSNLEWMTQKQNIDDKFARGYTPPRRQSKKNVLDIYYLTILKRYGFERYGTMSLEDVSIKYNIDKDSIRRIIRKEVYKDIVKDLPIVAYYKIKK